jgi:hypothetical protein
LGGHVDTQAPPLGAVVVVVVGGTVVVVVGGTEVVVVGATVVVVVVAFGLQVRFALVLEGFDTVSDFPLHVTEAVWLPLKLREKVDAPPAAATMPTITRRAATILMAVLTELLNQNRTLRR